MKIKELWHQLGSPRWFYHLSGRWVPTLGVFAFIFLTVGFIWGLLFAPADYQQGNSFRIMYVHVPAAILSQSLYLAMGCAGFVLYVWRMKLADVVIASCLPLGMSLTLLALFSGAVWGKPTWGTWWEWDGRIVSTTVLLFLYIGIFAIREAIADSELRGKASGLVAMVGTINIPIIKYSVDWWTTLHQSATFTLTEKPLMPSEMWVPLLVMLIGFYFFAAHNILNKMRAEILRREMKTSWVRALLVKGELN